jgi:hypothetical protein
VNRRAPKPSVPEVTWEFVDYSYDVPATYETDPFTGESEIDEPGYHRDNRTLVVKLKNQQFVPYEYANGNYASLYYGIRLKGHYEDEWTYAPKPRYYGYHNASDSEYTIISLRIASYGLSDIIEGGKIDLQVEALIGNDKRVPTMTPWGESCYYEFTGETSGWSQTLIITYPYGSEPAPVNTLDADSPANLTCDIHGLSFVTDGGLRLLVSGDVINTGAQTAYGVELHIETWFPDGRKGLDEIVKLNQEIYFILPAKPVNIVGGESYTLTSRWFSGLVVSVSGIFWLDEWGKDYPYDLISSYKITPIWSDTQ